MRGITYRGRGDRHGPITRLMSPGDVGEMAKPFVFLDLFEVDRFTGRGFPPHPHSGIATLTLFLRGSMTYADSTGQSGALAEGAVEWMRAGGGVWHAGEPAPEQPMRGYQLWLALPPELELAPPESLYLEPGTVQAAGPARVVLGQYEGVRSPVPLEMPLTYLHVRLDDGQAWRFTPPSGQGVAWLALNQGRLRVSGTILEREMAVFEPGEGAIDMVAEGAVELVLGAAAPHGWPLVCGQYSVHTSAAALAQGERNIAALRGTEPVQALMAV